MPLAARVALYGTVIAGAMYALQDKMLYHPGTEKLPELLQHASSLGLSPWPDAGAYRGWMPVTPPDSPHGTVIVFHGNGGLALHRNYYVDALAARGYRVLLAEYPVYGDRPGEVGETAFVADAVQTLALVQREFGLPVYVFGESLGAGVAAATVAQSSVPVAGVAMITPWANLPEIAQDVFWYLPARWLVRDRYDSIANLNRWGGPVAVVIAARDEIIPARHGQKLYDSLVTPKRRWVFEDGSHNNWPIEADAPWWSEVLEFLQSRTAIPDPAP